eukprot:Seg21331.1 transcript_id=Seg21331.1/GoldUCD/mRNA.D3Y31 product="putative 2-succinyl-6-hydroxy-2 4-cyclohexadiene-1-carboxylate synthase" protein_id=Seg21331.1/GoldUCD/D3Y31
MRGNAEQKPFSRVDLWQYLACCPMSLKEVGTAFNKEVKAQKPNLLGYSMGGRLALHALLDEPSKWNKAVIVSAHTGLPADARDARLAHDAAWAAKALKGDWKEFLTEWNAQGVLQDSTTLPDRNALEPRRQAVARSFMDWSLGQQEDLRKKLHKITSPVLWVVGEHDEKFGAIAEEAVTLIPHAELVTIPNAHHRVPWDRPTAFAEAIHHFLTD